MDARTAIPGTFPDSGIVIVHETCPSGMGAEPASDRDPMDRKWMGMLLAAAFPRSDPASKTNFKDGSQVRGRPGPGKSSDGDDT